MPRQRGNLALPQMAFTTDALEFGLRQHTAFSKEAAVVVMVAAAAVAVVIKPQHITLKLDSKC